MKKQIQLAAPPDYSSLVPASMQAGGDEGPPPTSSGMDMDNLSPEEASAVPDEGTANIGFKVHHRHSDTRIDKDGNKTEHHTVRMHVHHFEPHTPEAKPKGKKLTDSTNASAAAGEGLGAAGSLGPDGTP